MNGIIFRGTAVNRRIFLESALLKLPLSLEYYAINYSSFQKKYTNQKYEIKTLIYSYYGIFGGELQI